MLQLMCTAISSYFQFWMGTATWWKLSVRTTSSSPVNSSSSHGHLQGCVKMCSTYVATPASHFHCRHQQSIRTLIPDVVSESFPRQHSWTYYLLIRSSQRNKILLPPPTLKLKSTQQLLIRHHWEHVMWLLDPPKNSKFIQSQDFHQHTGRARHRQALWGYYLKYDMTLPFPKYFPSFTNLEENIAKFFNFYYPLFYVFFPQPLNIHLLKMSHIPLFYRIYIYTKTMFQSSQELMWQALFINMPGQLL